MKMFDTIHFWLPDDRVKNTDLLAETPLFLNNVTEHYRGGKVSVTGSVGGNIRVNVSDSGISLKGSLCKYYFGNNYQTLTRPQTQKAIEKLSDEIHLPIDLAKVFRIDFAENLEVKYKPDTYLNYLGECQYYRRQYQANSLYYTTGIRTKLFYDKLLEGKKQGMKLPNGSKASNMLRYEVRFTGRLPKQFNRPVITASLLTDQKFYTGLVKRWAKEYERINKLNIVNLKLSKMSTPKDFKKQLAALKIAEIGELEALQMVEQLRAMKAFNKPEYYSRLKREIKSLCKSPATSKQSDLIVELDQKITQVKNGISLI